MACPCEKLFPGLDLPLLTSGAVLTELFHLFANRRIEMESAWRFIHSGAVTVGVIQDDDLSGIHTLMARYADRPMDFADATLVYLAKRKELTTIFTVDHSDFEIYRIEGRRRFHVLPAGRV